MRASLVLILLTIGMVAAPPPQAAVGNGTFSRNDAITCVLKYVDGLRKTSDPVGHPVWSWGPKDGCVNAAEIDAAKERYLSDVERLATSIVKSTLDILWDCDYDSSARSKSDTTRISSGCISRSDMVGSVDRCLNNQDKLNMLNNAVCKRAADLKPTPPV